MKRTIVLLIMVVFFIGLSAQDAKSPIPSNDEVKTALATVKDVFKEEYKKLKTPDDRKALAKKLLEQAADSSNTPAMVYALITESARIAGEAGDIATIAEASKLFAEKFEGDTLTVRVKMFEYAEKVNVKPKPEFLSALAEEYLKLADEAIAADKLKDAGDIADSAARIAKKAKNTAVVAKAGEKKKEAANVLNSLKNVSTSIDTLKTNPEDPEANLAVGKYVCFTKGDWDKGLLMLAKGSDKDYKGAAELELAATDTASTMKSADKWWDIADKEKAKPAKIAVMSHSVTLYGKVLPELGGIDKVKAEKRMKEAETLDTAVSKPTTAGAKIISSGKSSLPHEIAKIAKEAREIKGKVIKVSPDGKAEGTVTFEDALKQVNSGMIIHFTPGTYTGSDIETTSNIILEGEKGAYVKYIGKKDSLMVRNLDIGYIYTLGNWGKRETNIIVDCRILTAACYEAITINTVIGYGEGFKGGLIYNCTFYSGNISRMTLWLDELRPSTKFFNCIISGDRFCFGLISKLLSTPPDKNSRFEFENCLLFASEAVGMVVKDFKANSFLKTFTKPSDMSNYFTFKNCIEAKPEFENVEGDDFFKWNLRLKPGSSGSGKAKGGGDLGANLDAEGYPVP